MGEHTFYLYFECSTCSFHKSVHLQRLHPEQREDALNWAMNKHVKARPNCDGFVRSFLKVRLWEGFEIGLREGTVLGACDTCRWYSLEPLSTVDEEGFRIAYEKLVAHHRKHKQENCSTDILISVS